MYHHHQLLNRHIIIIICSQSSFHYHLAINKIIGSIGPNTYYCIMFSTWTIKKISKPNTHNICKVNNSYIGCSGLLLNTLEDAARLLPCPTGIHTHIHASNGYQLHAIDVWEYCQRTWNWIHSRIYTHTHTHTKRSKVILFLAGF